MSSPSRRRFLKSLAVTPLVPAAAPVTYLAWFSPGGVERYCAELAVLIAAEPVWPPADLGPANALAARYDVLPTDP